MSEKSIELQQSRLQDRFHSTPAYQVTSIGSGLQEGFSRASRDTSPLTPGFLIVYRTVVGVDCNAAFSAYLDPTNQLVVIGLQGQDEMNL